MKAIKRIAVAVLAALMIFTVTACQTDKNLSAKSYTGTTTVAVGEVFSLNLNDYFENTTDNTTYTANIGTITGTTYTLEVAAGINNITITANDGDKSATLSITLTGNVVEGQIAAKAYTGATEGSQGLTFKLDNLSNHFVNTTDNTTYTSNIGLVTGKVFELLLTEGEKAIEITATEGSKSAKLKITLTVATHSQLAQVNKTRAVEYAKLIKQLYWNSNNNTSKLTPTGGTPYLWPYTEQAAMCNAVLEILDPVADAADYAFMKQYLIETLQGLRYYRVSKAGKPYTDTDFGVLSAGKDSYAAYNSGKSNNYDSAGANKNGIYFDDNIWVAKEFYFGYKNVGDVKYLNESINILNWIIGEGYETRRSSEGTYKDQPMAGIYWLWGVKDIIDNGIMDDSKTASLNSCSSAPTAMMLLKVAELLEDIDGDEYKDMISDYRTKGNAIVGFMTKVLRRSDGMYRDKIFLRKNTETDAVYLGPLDEQVLGYNTGCMMTAGAELYKYNNAKGVLDLTSATAANAHNYFANTVAVAGQYAYDKNSWFTSFLIDGYIDLYDYADTLAYVDRMRSALDYGWKNNRAADGLVAPGWVQGWSVHPDAGSNSEGNGRQILLQSANAHSYAMLARFYEARAKG